MVLIDWVTLYFYRVVVETDLAWSYTTWGWCLDYYGTLTVYNCCVVLSN